MKVNLSYSVELEEVLHSVERLYLESKLKFERNYNLLTSVNTLEFTNAHLENTVRNLAAAQEATLEFANKLEEVQGILTGYQGVITNALAPPPPPEPDAKSRRD